MRAAQSQVSDIREHRSIKARQAGIRIGIINQDKPTITKQPRHWIYASILTTDQLSCLKGNIQIPYSRISTLQSHSKRKREFLKTFVARSVKLVLTSRLKSQKLRFLTWNKGIRTGRSTIFWHRVWLLWKTSK